MSTGSLKNLVRCGMFAGLIECLVGCSYLKPSDKGILEGYKTISERSEFMLAEPREKMNYEIIQEGQLPIYSGEKFEKESFEDFYIIKYHARNINSKSLKKTLDEQLTGVVGKVSEIPETNQVIIRVDTKTTDTQNYARAENNIKKFIESVDITPPQIMIEMRMTRDFADKTIDWASFLGISPRDIKGDGLYPNILLAIPGAGLRVPERGAGKGLGIQYGIIGEIGRNIINARLDSLQSQGFVKDIARPTLTVASGRKAKINLKQELPYQDQVFQGGALFSQTKYKDVNNFMEMIPWARGDNVIYLENIKAGVGSFNPTGVLQVPGITQRNIENEGIYLKQGETLVLGGFRIDHKIGIERIDPWFGKIPIISHLFPWAEDTEKSINEIIFLMTPYYININHKQEVKEITKKEEGIEKLIDYLRRIMTRPAY